MTKIFAFTDPHGDMRAALAIVDAVRASNPDLVLCTGDFSWFGMKHEAFLRKLALLKREILFVPGNHESADTCQRLPLKFPFMKDVSYQIVEQSDVRIAGIPGNDKAFWPGRNPEDDAFDLAINLWGSLDHLKPLILLSHYPPTNTSVSGTSKPTPDAGGSLVVRKIIEALKPVLFVCGHYHQDFGRSCQLGQTRLVNPGPTGTIIEI